MERREIRIICPIARDRYVEPIDGPRGGTGNAVHDFDQNRGINRLFPMPALVVPVTEVITYLNFSGNVAAKFGEQRNDRLASFLKRRGPSEFKNPLVNARLPRHIPLDSQLTLRDGVGDLIELGENSLRIGRLNRFLLVRHDDDPPPLKWSDLRYVFDIQEDCNGKEAIQA